MAALDEVEVARQRLSSLNPDDKVAYFPALNLLANALVSRFKLSTHQDDLDEGITVTKQVLDLAPPGHSFHAAALSNMGQVLSMRFKFRGDASDLTQAINHFEAAVASSTPEQSSYIPFVGNLASGLLSRYRMFGDVTDLDLIIETSSTVLSASLAHAQHPGRDSLLNNLGNALKERFVKQGNNADLNMALVQYQSCLHLRPPGHPLRHSVLGNLADAMLLRFEIDGHLQDLENAADHYTSALKLCSPGQEAYLSHLTSLGIVYWQFFNVEKKVERLEMAIFCYQTAMEHSTLPNLDHSRLLDNYGAALQSRYTALGNVDDLDQAIQYLATSSTIVPPTFYSRHITLFNLGVALVTRFNVTSNLADLDSSIENLVSAVQLCAPQSHLRPAMLSVYGRAIFARFIARGDAQDRDLAVSTCKIALALVSPKEADYLSTVASLTSTLLDYCHESGNSEVLQIVVDHCDRALVSSRPEEPTLVSLKIIRAKTFLYKFKSEREEKDIYTCIDAFREIIPTVPQGHKDYVKVHLQLGMALEACFQLSSDQKDLDECMALHRTAHRDCKYGDPDYASVCMELGNALRQRFEYYYDTDALDEAIVLLAKAEEILSPMPGHIDSKSSLVNLGIALFIRFQAQSNRDDLDNAIEYVSRALTSCGEDFVIPFCFATLLSVRYTWDNDLKDLERGVELFSFSAEHMPPKHLLRGVLCRNYGSALAKLGRHRDPLEHFNAAIGFFAEAINHLPASHCDHIQTCIDLAQLLRYRATLLRDGNDLHSAIQLLRGVMQTAPENDSTHRSACHEAASLFLWMYSQEQRVSFMEDGFRYFEKAARYSYHDSFMSVLAALEWAEHADKLQHLSALPAYRTSLVSLHKHLLTTMSIKGRHTALLEKHWAKRPSTLATDATSCAIARGELRLAVEFSEQGRGLLWSQLAQSRTPLDGLRSASEAGRALASEFERVGAELTQSVVGLDESHTAITASRLLTEEVARRYGQLSKELEEIVARIRLQEGFESFLEPPSFERLQHAAVGGPVILVNVSDKRCDAVIVLHGAPPRLVPLPNTSLEELAALSTRFHQMLRKTARVGDEKLREREVMIVLRTLWDVIVGPIVDELVSLAPRGSRIWWCPTSRLTTLPLHAAGPYRKGAPNLQNLYVSSYTPTLAALIRARRRPSSSTHSSPPPAFVAIGQAQPASSTGPALQTVSSELSLVESLLPRSPPSAPFSFSVLDGEASTADAALAALATHSWAHIACHGYPNVEQPFDAAFALSDRAATVLEIVRARGVTLNASTLDEHVASTAPGEFAFLSACHTAVGDGQAPDEIIHLAAAMQFAGFRSVVGTMWAVDDGMVQRIVKAFYECLFAVGDGGIEPWDCMRAARALNKAIKLVDKDLVSLDQRIVFIHIGA